MEKLVGCFRIVQYPESDDDDGIGGPGACVSTKVSSSLAVLVGDDGGTKKREIYIVYVFEIGV